MWFVCFKLFSAPIFILLSLLEGVQIQTLAIPLWSFRTLAFGVDIEKNLRCVIIAYLDLRLVFVWTMAGSTRWFVTVSSLVWLTVLLNRSLHFALPTATSTTIITISFLERKPFHVDVKIHTCHHLDHACFRYFNFFCHAGPSSCF